MLHEILALAEARAGHFRLESGYHTDQWLELDPLFVRASRVRPLTDELAVLLAKHRVSAVCGPLVGGAFVAQAVAATLGVDALYTERVQVPTTSLEGETDGSLFRARYSLPRALVRRAENVSIAVVDDVVSAGSSVRATVAALEAVGGRVAVVGALMAMGSAAEEHFAARGIPVVSVARTGITLWPPSACPLCRDGVPLEETAPAA